MIHKTKIEAVEAKFKKSGKFNRTKFCFITAKEDDTALLITEKEITHEFTDIDTIMKFIDKGNYTHFVIDVWSEAGTPAKELIEQVNTELEAKHE